MKGIILNFDEATESIEVYDSKPHYFLTIFVILISVLLIGSVVYMAFVEKDIVVKGIGVIIPEHEPMAHFATMSGPIAKCNIKNGQFIQQGDLLYELDHNDIDKEIEFSQTLLNAYENQDSMIAAYLQSLETSENHLEEFKDNPYYDLYLTKYNIYLNKRDIYESTYYDRNICNLQLEEKNTVIHERDSIRSAKERTSNTIRKLLEEREKYFFMPRAVAILTLTSI